MAKSGNEYNLLVPLIPAILVAPVMALMGFEPHEASFLIVLAPFLAFPVIIVLGQLYNGNAVWKHKLKEGARGQKSRHAARACGPVADNLREFV